MVQYGCNCGQSVHIAPCPWADVPAQPVSIHSPVTLVGWRCPSCQGGVSPFATRCPCVPLPAPPIAFGTGVGLTLVEQAFSGYGGDKYDI